MANGKVISFDLIADFAFFKKPDFNDGMQLSYNMLHKPALLGILGAIMGLEGYQRNGELPKYYQLLKDLPVGIEPLRHERGIYQKTSVKYTNGVGYANADGTLLVEETMLIKPAYRCYLQLSFSKQLHQTLLEYISKGHFEFIPYLGKNEFHAWIENVQIWEGELFDHQDIFRIDGLFVKNGTVADQKVIVDLAFAFDYPDDQVTFSYFERLPIGINEELMQYQMNDFAFTNWKLKPETRLSSLYRMRNEGGEKIIQFF